MCFTGALKLIRKAGFINEITVQMRAGAAVITGTVLRNELK